MHGFLTDRSRFDQASRNFEDNQKVELLALAIQRVQSRPLYIHLAKAQMDAGKFDEARVCSKSCEEREG